MHHIEDPLQGDFPEVIEEYLEHGCMKCIAFNRRGTLLAGNPFLSVSLIFIFNCCSVLSGYSPLMHFRAKFLSFDFW